MLVFSAAAGAGQMLEVEFSGQRPSGAKVYGTESAAPSGVLRVVSGGTVTLQAESGRHYEVRATGWRWSQVQEVPAYVNAVKVTPTVKEGQVTMDITVYQQDQDRRYNYDTTVSGRLGEWIEILGSSNRSRPGTKVYGTSSSTPSRGQTPTLYVRVQSSPQ